MTRKYLLSILTASSRFDLPRGWLAVKEAKTLPLPDTSWMNNPLKRSKFARWLG